MSIEEFNTAINSFVSSSENILDTDAEGVFAESISVATELMKELDIPEASLNAVGSVQQSLESRVKEVEEGSSEHASLSQALKKTQNLYYDMTGKARSKKLTPMFSEQIVFTKETRDKLFTNLIRIGCEKEKGTHDLPGYQTFLMSYVNILVDEEDSVELDSKSFFGKHSEIDDNELEDALLVTGELIKCLAFSDENTLDSNIKNFIEGLKGGENPSANVRILFKMLQYLSLEDLQVQYCEPFEEKFSDIPLKEAPGSIFELTPTYNLTSARFNDLGRGEEKTKEEKIKIRANKREAMKRRVAGFFGDVDYSKFDRPRRIDISDLYMKSEDYNKISKGDTLKKVRFGRQNLRGYDLSNLGSVTKLDLSQCSGLTAEQFNAIDKSRLEIIILPKGQNLTGFSFAGATKLKKLDIYDAQHKTLSAATFHTIPKESLVILLLPRLTSDELSKYVSPSDIDNFDLSGFDKLRVMDLASYSCPSQGKIDTISRETLEKLAVRWDPRINRDIAFEGFSFSIQNHYGGLGYHDKSFIKEDSSHFDLSRVYYPEYDVDNRTL
ncbi:hypothetical protein AB751O23_CH_00020 [Chlamydiales bacterium SCGC AB-751-O23]|jgi:hypothetical protein|nr:hypothetical protein AB751O23_CH_00020 [Chlamydiales bacterium SCGC AB-751-O23]